MVLITTTGAALGLFSSAMASWMGISAYRDYQKQKNYRPLFNWDVDEVAEFITYLGESKKWRRKYPTIIHKKKIDGEYLNSCDKYDLMKLGFERKDAKKVLYAFSEVCGSIDNYTHHKPRKSSSPTRSEFEYAETFYSIRSLSDM